MRSTKIVATLGPASSSPEMIRRLIEAGMNVARMNFSHGSYDAHAANIKSVRDAARALGATVAILQDLQGPKIRTGKLKGGAPVELTAGQTFTITTEEIEGDAAAVHSTYQALPRDVRPGDRILLSDGLIELLVDAKTDTKVVATVIHGGALKERQGINLPGVNLSVAGLTEKDERDLEFGLAQGVDYVAISFVRRAADVRRVKEIIALAGGSAPVIAKLEKPEAIDALAEILDAADGAMVARGDLGVELPPEEVPLIQKRIIEEANKRGKPVITATQMLESMIENPRPTRAEASDVANAILDGTDAVMLSGETAVGAFPVQAVRTMVRIADVVEKSGRIGQLRADKSWAIREAGTIPEAIGAATSAIVDAMPQVAAVWVFTQSGNSARLISQYRPRVPILAFTPDEDVCRRLALLWGVQPIKIESAVGAAEFERRVFPIVAERGLGREGDIVVITGGHPFTETVDTNFLKIQELGKNDGRASQT